MSHQSSSSGGKTLISGGEVCAHVAYGLSDKVLLQPLSDIRFSGYLGDKISQEWAQNEKQNCFGRVPEVRRLMKGESTLEVTSDAPTAIITGSGMLKRMIPNMHHIASKDNASLVVHASCLTVNNDSATLVESDFVDIGASRETGFAIISSGNVQEAHDMAVLCHILSKKFNKPFLHFFDGTRVGAELASVDLISYDSLLSQSTVSTSASLLESLEEILHSSSYKLFEYHGPEDAEAVVISMASAGPSMLEAVRATKNSGLLIVRVLRPWSAKHLLNALPKTTRRICVIDQNKSDSPLFKDVVASFHSEAQWAAPMLINASIVTSSKVGFTPAISKAILDELHSAQPQARFTLHDLKIEDMLTSSVVHASNLIRQVVSWTVGPTNASHHGVAVVLGPLLNLQVQQHDSHSQLTKLTRSDIRFGPVTISSEYPVLSADVISCNDPAVLFLPQCDILAQAKKGTILLLNVPWKTVEQAEAELDPHLRSHLASLEVKLYTADASGLAHRESNWVMQALMMNLCNSPQVDYGQFFGHLAKVVELPVDIVDKLRTSPDSLLHQIEYPVSTWHTPQQQELLADFVPLDMVPSGVLASVIDSSLGAESSSTLQKVPAYGNLLEQLFGGRLVVADTSTSSESLEACFGGYLVKAQARKRLVEFVGKSLSGKRGPLHCSKDLQAALSIWHQTHDNALRCGKVVPRLLDLLEKEVNHSDTKLEYIYKNRNLLPKSTKWIIGSESWSYDLAGSGIRHILASNEDINILVLETNPYHEDNTEIAPEASPADLDSSVMSVLTTTKPTAPPKAPSSSKKKNIGLYAMNYGTAYVASVSVMASQSQAMRALSEADSFKGPSIILAHAPAAFMEQLGESTILNTSNQSLHDHQVENVAQQAVESGEWPLYRWNPQQEHDEFTLDSAKIKADIEKFLQRDQHLTMLATEKPKLPGNASLEYERESQHHGLKEAADKRRLNQQFDQLADAIGGRNPDLNLLVLYGSDGGNASGVAEKLGKKAEVSGCGEVRVMEANDFNIDELSEEQHLVLVLATAGQGEPCANAKTFCENLMESSSKLPGLKFAVFGMGDSHYWGDNTEDSAKYFCLNAREIDQKLVDLGADRAVACGLGDDQNDDGYEGALTEWEPRLWDALEVTINKDANLGGPPQIIDDDIKESSQFLRGMIAEGLQDMSTLKLLPEDTKITKFHGIYQQDLRTVRDELDAQGLERAYSFMIRVGIPGGVASSEQYVAMDQICSDYCNGALKLTTRQAYQVHGVVKKDLKKTMQAINRAALDTLAACGDVNRNVIANPHWRNSSAHAEVKRLAQGLQAHLRPRTSGYAEIWLDKKPVAGSIDHEPIYGPTYLPRKFKIAIAVPPLNDVDVFAHCLGYIAIVDSNGNLEGYNVTVGGGMGTTHGNTATYPRLADVMGFCKPEQAITVAEKVVLIQRDNGHRTNRKHARLKYTLEDLGMEYFRGKVEELAGFKLEEARPFKFDTNYDPYGWHQSPDGLWSYVMFVENGYIKDREGYPIKTALREIAEFHTGGEFSLTATQNLIIGAITPERKPQIESLMRKYNIDNSRYSGMRLHSMACVALPTCALAMAESQTYLPSLVDKLEMVLGRYGLRNDAISIRMTGCPNGCGRAPVCEIGFVGKAPGVYNMMLGGGFAGNRINKIYREGVNEEEIIQILDPMFSDYAKDRLKGERFGDFCVRTKIIEPTLHGRCFWSKGAENDLSTPSGTTQIYW